MGEKGADPTEGRSEPSKGEREEQYQSSGTSDTGRLKITPISPNYL